MALPTAQLRGITTDLASQLKERGLKDSEQFLAAVKTPKQRAELAKALAADEKAILELANRADLARIKGIGEVFADLLEQGGVDTVKELARRVPENLHATLIELNQAKKISGRQPTLDMVKDWVAQAKDLPKLLEYQTG
jgi:predicted flap endonuclease-1-like 5' DNA nuclease